MGPLTTSGMIHVHADVLEDLVPSQDTYLDYFSEKYSPQPLRTTGLPPTQQAQQWTAFTVEATISVTSCNQSALIAADATEQLQAAIADSTVALTVCFLSYSHFFMSMLTHDLVQTLVLTMATQTHPLSIVRTEGLQPPL